MSLLYILDVNKGKKDLKKQFYQQCYKWKEDNETRRLNR